MKKYFEEFISESKGKELFSKAQNFSKYIREAIDSAEQSLGVQLLTSTKPIVKIKNRKGQEQAIIMLGSNSYLNLSNNPKVIDAAVEAVKKYGYGMGAVSLYAGITDLHKELEKMIARFYKTDDAILFPSGYGANVGIISALCHEEDVIINDSANHASIFDGCRLSGAEIKVYPHNNMKRLEHILKNIPNEQKGRLIITDGVFSMHGDIAKLDEIVSLAEKYNARVMVDDAHGLGIVGKKGRGTAEIYGVQDKIDLNVGMLSKSPGGLGGYCAAKQEVIDYLKMYSRTYFFSTALPASVVAGLIEVFKLLENDEAGRQKLIDNVSYLKNALDKAGFTIGVSSSGIIPIIVGDEDKLADFHALLMEKGVYTNLVSYPAVRRKECRLRLCVMSSFDKDIMDSAVDIIIRSGKELGLI